MQTFVANSTVPIACAKQQKTVQNTAKRTLELTEAGELRATTWKMFCIDLLSHYVMYTLRPDNSAALLGKQWRKTKAHSAVPHCYSNQAAICKNRHCKWRLAKKRNMKELKKRHL